MTGLDFIKRFGFLQAKDLLKSAPFETTHIGVDEDGFYRLRKDDRGNAIFNKPNQEWWSLGVCECDTCEIHELKDLIESHELIRHIGDNIQEYLDGKMTNFRLHGLKYSHERIIQAFNLVQSFESNPQ